MIDVCWRTYRRALATLASCVAALGIAVVTGYALAQADPVPPATAVTPAPSGAGQLGRAPAVPTVVSRPTRTTPSPDGAIYEPPPRRPRKPSPTPSPSASPTVAATPLTETSLTPPGEPAETVTPTP